MLPANPAFWYEAAVPIGIRWITGAVSRPSLRCISWPSRTCWRRYSANLRRCCTQTLVSPVGKGRAWLDQRGHHSRRAAKGLAKWNAASRHRHLDLDKSFRRQCPHKRPLDRSWLAPPGPEPQAGWNCRCSWRACQDTSIKPGPF